MSRRLSAAVLPLILLAPGLLCGQSDAGLARFIHPNAKALISINWALVRQSRVGAMIREKWLAKDGASPQIPGLEFINDIDRVLISSTGHTGDDENAETPVLFVIGGHFDLAKVRAVLGSVKFKPQQFNSFQVYRSQGSTGKDMAVVLVDKQTILIGDPSSVFASLERNAFAPPPPDPNSILGRAAEMEANYDVWLLGTGFDTLAGDRLSGLFGDDQISAEARGFEAGISLRSGLAADLAIRFETEASAKKLADGLAKLLEGMVKDKADEPVMLELEKKLKITAEGSAAKINLRLTPQELEKNARMFASMSKPAAAVEARSATVAVQPPPKPEKQVIRIEGLDDGPREIPLR